MEAIIGAILTVLTYTWWIIVPVLLFLVFQAYRRRVWISEQRYVLLRISVPKENEKAPVAAEQMFAALHGLHRNSRTRFFEGSVQEHLGFEIVSQGNRIHFYAYVPAGQKSFVEGQIYAQYPKCEIEPVEDYVRAVEYERKAAVGTELRLTKKDAYPIKTFLNFEDVDPLSGITAVMGDLAEGEEVWVQVLARPADDSWRHRGEAELQRLQGGGGAAGGVFGAVGRFIGELFTAATAPPDPKAGAKPGTPATPVQVDEAISSGIKDKAAKLGYQVKIRLVAVAADQAKARNRLNSAVGAFKQYNTTNLNGFVIGKVTTKTAEVVTHYRSRSFTGRGPVLNIEELASVFHLPNISVETPTISWSSSAKGEPPKNLPIEGSQSGLTLFAEANFRDKLTRFGIQPEDRRRHIYAIGKTGMGKTNMLENMVLADMKAGRGLAVVDPHGDFIETIIDHIPEDRVDDVIVFNPADRTHPIAFNILEKVDRDAKPLVASGVVGVFEKIYGHSWGPRLEHILRNTILALLDYPDSTLLDVPKLLANEAFRAEVVKHIEDPVVKNYWTDEFANYTERQRVEAIAPIQNKVGQFLSATTIRNIVGQQHTAINLREVMDSGKILLLKLSKGELGEDAAALLGAMLITKIQLAAMSRADIPESERRDFYLFVDEFQNFATLSFVNILSEARKYGLNLAMANQYIAQMPEEVRDAVFGNIGTIVSFRVGAADAQWLAKEFEPVFTEVDVVNLDKFHIYVKLAIDGVTGDAFSAKTIPLPPDTTAFRETVISRSRERYAQPREAVEAKILDSGPAMTAGGTDSDESKKRRYQSYLDKERTFAEQLQTGGAAPAEAATPRAAGTEKPAAETPKPVSRPAPQEKSHRRGQPGARPTAPAKAKRVSHQAKRIATPQPASKPSPSKSPQPAAHPRPAEQPRPAPAPKQEANRDDLAEGVTIEF